MSRKVRFGLLLNEKEAIALQRMAQYEGESRATILRRLLRAEAQRLGFGQTGEHRLAPQEAQNER